MELLLGCQPARQRLDGGILAERALQNDGGKFEVFRCEGPGRRSPRDPGGVDSTEGGREEKLKGRDNKVTTNAMMPPHVILTLVSTGLGSISEKGNFLPWN